MLYKTHQYDSFYPENLIEECRRRREERLKGNLPFSEEIRIAHGLLDPDSPGARYANLSGDKFRLKRAYEKKKLERLALRKQTFRDSLEGQNLQDELTKLLLAKDNQGERYRSLYHSNAMRQTEYKLKQLRRVEKRLKELAWKVQIVIELTK